MRDGVEAAEGVDGGLDELLVLVEVVEVEPGGFLRVGRLAL